MLSLELMKYTEQQSNEQKPHDYLNRCKKKKKSTKCSARSYNSQQASYWNLRRKRPQLDKKESASNLYPTSDLTVKD